MKHFGLPLLTIVSAGLPTTHCTRGDAPRDLVAGPTTAVHPGSTSQGVPVLDLPFDTGFSFSDPLFAPLPNGATFTQDLLVSHQGWQFAAYWNADRRLTLARRELPAADWEIFSFSDYLIPGQDAHNNVSLGLCPVDGTLHLAFDHHGDPLRYRRSVPGLATSPDAFGWDESLFGAITDVLVPADGPIDKVTYPRFLPTPAGNLQFVYREFSSGNGRTRLVDYAAATGEWFDDRILIERLGAHEDPLGGSSGSRNPYLNRIDYDDQGTLHVTFTWREKAPTPYNRDILYAYSEDGGRRWFNGAHEAVADTDLGQVLDQDTPGLRAIELGAEWGLLNNQGHLVDARGRVHAVMFHKDQPDDQVSYGNSSNSHYRHHWLDADGVWRTTVLPTIGSRPHLFEGPNETLVLAYRTGRDLAIDVATARETYSDWQRVLLVDANLRTDFNGDRARLAETGILDAILQDDAEFPGAPSTLRLFSIDLRAKGLQPDSAPGVAVTHHLPVLADAYVRSGVHADTPHGDEPRLLVKEDGNVDFDRRAYLRFDVSTLRTGETVEAVELIVRSPVSGPLARTTPYAASFVADDSWTETELTWNTAPPIGDSLAAHFGRDTLRFDVTERALEAAAGDGLLSLALTSEREGSDRILHLWAREAVQAESIPSEGAPRLRVRRRLP